MAKKEFVFLNECCIEGTPLSPSFSPGDEEGEKCLNVSSRLPALLGKEGLGVLVGTGLALQDRNERLEMPTLP